MFDKKLLIPIFLVLIFILAILILPVLDLDSHSESVNAGETAQINTSVTPDIAPTDTPEITVRPTPEQSAAPANADLRESQFIISDKILESIEGTWPIAGSVEDFGDPTINYIDIDNISNSTYLTYMTTSTLDEQAAIEQYGTAIFGTAPDTAYSSGTITDKNGNLISVTLDITQMDNTLYTRINFTLPERLDIATMLQDENPWLSDLWYEGFSDDTIFLEGITSPDNGEISLYRIFDCPADISARALDWYKTTFADYTNYTETPVRSSTASNISFECDGCKVVIYDFTDSDMIKVSIISKQK